MALDQAICELNQAIEAGPGTPQWQRLLRMRLAAVREALADDDVRFRDGWLAARGAVTDRSRHQLLARLTALTPQLREGDATVTEVRRLSTDLQRYRQRLHDLVYDSVGIELGGSE